MKELFIAFILFLIIDLPYLILFAGDYYSNLIKNIQKTKFEVKPLGALLAYIIMSIGVKYLVLDRSKSVNDVIYNGFLTALVGYGLFDFTNYAIFKNWTLIASIKDLIWGVILFTSVSYLTYKILRYRID